MLIAKLASAIFLYYSLNISASGTFWSDSTRVFDWPQNQVLLANINGSHNWPLTFVGWDSAWYISIMTKGYAISTQSYTFSPALPFMGYLLNFVLQDPLMSITIVSLLFGVLYIPLLQLLSENFVSKKTALLSTLLFAFFPYVFVFTSVVYSEGVMLFFIIGAWLLASRGKIFEASLFGMLAPLARTMGILVVIPLLYYSFKDKKRRLPNVLLSFLPVISLVTWFIYLGSVTGVPMAPVSTTEWSQLWTVRTLLLDGIPHYGLNAVTAAAYQIPPVTTFWLLPIAVWISLSIPLILSVTFWGKNRLLWLYAVAGYLGVLFFGAIVSTPRFISMLFPFGLLLSSYFTGDRKSIIVTAVLVTIFLIVSIDLWQGFLNGEFIA